MSKQNTVFTVSNKALKIDEFAFEVEGVGQNTVSVALAEYPRNKGYRVKLMGFKKENGEVNSIRMR